MFQLYYRTIFRFGEKQVLYHVEKAQNLHNWPINLSTLLSLLNRFSCCQKRVCNIEITSWLVSAYDFYSRVVKDR